MNAMDNPSPTESFPRADRKPDRTVLEVLGASIQFLVGPQQDEDAPLRAAGTITASSKVQQAGQDRRVDNTFIR